jgi:tRNA (guanine-N7-)-methyltransferase
MSRDVIVAAAAGLPRPIDLSSDLGAMARGSGPWELEVGFGKGRYLLRRAASRPDRRFVGIELVGRYFRLAAERAAKRGLKNLVLLQGDALYLLSAVLPAGFARVIHVYFPDPWPKSRHQKRRLLDAGTADLLLGALEIGGRLLFATDHLEYGEAVRELLAAHPGARLEVREGVWDDGPRTNYEAKYVREGRPILRLELERLAIDAAELIHPAARAEVVSALSRAQAE